MHRHLRFHEVFLLFLPMAAIVTLAHEIGHLVPVWLAGFEGHLGYRYASYEGDGGEHFQTWFSLSGPLSTMLAGTTGWLWLRRSRRRTGGDEPLGAWGWAALILTLFWFRQVFNAAGVLRNQLSGKHLGHGDELTLASTWGLPGPSLTYGTALAGLFFCSQACLRLCPASQRKALLIGAIPAGLVGYKVWYGWMGPWLLP